MAENTRELVLDSLLVLEREGIFSHKLLRDVLDKYDYLDSRDKAFIKRVTEGTLERQIELDHYLNQVSDVPVRKMKPLIRCLLRMSAYQLLFMDSVPDSAVCNEACKLADKRKFHNLKGFVNGVLRSMAKRKGALTLPDAEAEPIRYLSVRYSMPEWLVDMWLQEYGTEVVETMLGGLLQVHPVSLRFRQDMDQARIDELVSQMREMGVKVRKSACLPYLFLAEEVGGITSLPGYEEGAFVVQDASSALAVEAAGIRPGDFVMDICAAPGGKSMLAAEKAAIQERDTDLRGVVLARDVSESKVARIEQNRERMGYQNIRCQIFDATALDETYVEKADVVLMDVPCSGLGVIGKKRDIKYRITAEELKSLVQLQKKIVENSWRYVKPGGILLYSTCTIHREENEEMVKWILENFPFETEPIGELCPEGVLRAKGLRYEETLGDACVQLMPGFGETDGFFFARLRRKTENEQTIHG